MIHKVLICSFCFLLHCSSSLFATDVTVIANGAFPEKKGTIFISVCDKKGYSLRGNSKKCLVQNTPVLEKQTKYRFVFKNILPGEYVISGFQDIDGNNKLTTNWIGIPKEPVFFIIKLHGPPTFYSTKVLIQTTIQVVNLIGQEY